MNETEIFAALDQARQGLRDCLGELEASSPRDPNVGRTFSEVQEAFEVLGNLKLLRDRVGQEGQDRLQAHLEELLRLNALLSSAVVQDRDRLVGLLKQSHKGLQTMNAISKAAGPGDSNCDVSA